MGDSAFQTQTLAAVKQMEIMNRIKQLPTEIKRTIF
jgi:hypothetical protein